MSSASFVGRGFTLVELAIVLVIIGLIVGGVLVGQDMIKAAEIRSTVGQYEKYNAAINTFRTKYGDVPGDINATTVTKFGFVTRAGTAGRGDGNGLLTACNAGSVSAGCETVLFWRDLSFAGLIPHNLTAATDAPAFLTTATASTMFPTAKLEGNFFIVFSWQGANHYAITGITSTDMAGNYTLVPRLPPAAAYAIDTKLDNGRPQTGIIIASDSAVIPIDATPAAPAAGVCVSNAAGNPYNTSTTTYAETPACQLRLRFN